MSGTYLLRPPGTSWTVLYFKQIFAKLKITRDTSDIKYRCNCLFSEAPDRKFESWMRLWSQLCWCVWDEKSPRQTQLQLCSFRGVSNSHSTSAEWDGKQLLNGYSLHSENSKLRHFSCSCTPCSAALLQQLLEERSREHKLCTTMHSFTA